MRLILNILQKITQIGILTFLFAVPWTHWNCGIHGLGIFLGILYSIVIGIFILLSEFSEVFNNYYWYLTFKLRGYPKRIIDTNSDKKYRVGVVKGNYDHYVTFYKRRFPFWYCVHMEKISPRLSNPPELDEIEKSITLSVKEYEKYLVNEERKRKIYKKQRADKKGAQTKIRNWDGLIGDNKKSYIREKKLDKLLSKKPEIEHD